MIDIVEIKKLVEQGRLTSYVKDGIIYLQNDVGECVKIGETKDESIGNISKTAT